MFRLYNTLTRKEEEFQPADGHTVKLYTCGPTVYDYAHIGNLRTFVFYDILCRWLRYLGYEVRQVMNITDVDDKTIQRSRQEGVALAEYTRRYEQFFFEDLATLNVEPAWKYPRATEHIPQMLQMVQGLVEKGYAYVSQGNVYFDISKFPHYGRLSGVRPDSQARDSAFGRLQGDEYEREEAGDFALWKAAKPGEPSWDSPWGPGRPGWHIECSAMAYTYLGATLDIHVGAVDLLFPHHENEIAQSEAFTGEPFCRFWVHPEHLLVNGQKMSKSLGNFFTLRDLLDQGFRPPAIRHQLLTAHYRKQLNFTLESLRQSESTISHLFAFLQRLPQLQCEPGRTQAATTALEEAHAHFVAALNDDLNVPGAMAAVFEAVNRFNQLVSTGRLKDADRAALLDFLADADRVLGFMGEEVEKARAGEAPDLDSEIEALIAERNQARANKDFARADAIRDQLRARGIILEDTPAGTVWRKA